MPAGYRARGHHADQRARPRLRQRRQQRRRRHLLRCRAISHAPSFSTTARASASGIAGRRGIEHAGGSSGAGGVREREVRTAGRVRLDHLIDELGPAHAAELARGGGRTRPRARPGPPTRAPSPIVANASSASSVAPSAAGSRRPRATRRNRAGAGAAAWSRARDRRRLPSPSRYIAITAGRGRHPGGEPLARSEPQRDPPSGAVGCMAPTAARGRASFESRALGRDRVHDVRAHRDDGPEPPLLVDRRRRFG